MDGIKTMNYFYKTSKTLLHLNKKVETLSVELLWRGRWKGLPAEYIDCEYILSFYCGIVK